MIYERGVELPLSDRHIDVIVYPDPAGFPDDASLNKSQRAEVRALTQPHFSAVVRAFVPATRSRRRRMGSVGNITPRGRR